MNEFLFMKGSFSGAVDGGILNALDFWSVSKAAASDPRMCALQWNCINIYGQKCETNCLFLVAHILIEMVEERSWRNIAASQAVDVYIIYAPLVWEDYIQQFVKISPSASCM